MIVSIDPGATVGWAVWSDDGRLLQAGSITLAAFVHSPPPANLAIVEMPDHFAVKTRDVLTLAFRAGLCAGLYPQHQIVTVNQWKGSVPKKIMNRRIQTKISIPDNLTHHALDAIGVGLYYWGRL